MAADPHRFVISTFALWAGDLTYFRQLSEDMLEPSSLRRLEHFDSVESVDSPEEIMGLVAASRLELIQERAAALKEATQRVPQESLVLESAHLRGVVWALDDREFLLQAYLTDLEFEESLVSSARRLEASQPERMNRAGTPHGSPETTKARGASWVVPGDPFIRVELNDLALLEARAILTKEAISPRDTARIIEAFQALLHILDAKP